MNKLIKYFLCLLILTLTACTTEVDGKTLYNDAYNKTLDINDMQYHMHLNAKFDILNDDQLVTIYEIPFEFMAQIKGIKDGLEYHTNIQTKYNDEVITQNEWYKDGNAYIDDGYSKYMTKINVEDAYNLYSSLVLPKINSFEEIKVSNNGKNTNLLVNVSKDEMISQMNQMTILQITGLDFANLGDFKENIEISDISITLDHDGYIISESFEVVLNENESRMTLSIELNLSNINDVTIDEFDVTQFSEVSSTEIANDITLDEEIILVNDFDFIEYGDGILVKEINGEMRFIDLISKIYYTDEVCYDWEYNYGYDMYSACLYDFNTNSSQGDCESLYQSMLQLKNEYNQLYEELSLIIDSMKQ